jgi:integrase
MAGLALKSGTQITARSTMQNRNARMPGRAGSLITFTGDGSRLGILQQTDYRLLRKNGMGKDNAGKPSNDRGNHPQLVGWKAQLQELIDRHAGYRVDGRVASHRTRAIAATVLFAGFNTLHNELGMRVQTPWNIREEHIRRLVEYWHHAEGKKPGTMRTDLSIWRKFSIWIRKPSMVKELSLYLPNVDPKQLRVSSALTKPKSWSQNGIDVQAKIEEAFRLNERFGLILWAQLTFGLRIKEALCLKPWKADTGKGLMVYPGDGPKGGRPRFIPYLLPEQMVIIRNIKEHVKKSQWLGWQTTRRGGLASLEYNLQEYYKRMRAIGITKEDADVVGHGLRAEFAENMATVKGFCPVTLGGMSDQMAWDDLQVKIAEVSELMGHSRTQIMSSYFGVFKRPKSDDADAGLAYVGALASASAKTIPKPEKVDDSITPKFQSPPEWP